MEDRSALRPGFGFAAEENLVLNPEILSHRRTPATVGTAENPQTYHRRDDRVQTADHHGNDPPLLAGNRGKRQAAETYPSVRNL